MWREGLRAPRRVNEGKEMRETEISLRGKKFGKF